MVTAVYGYCNDLAITFTQNERGQWETTVPNTSARYVVEVWAEDAAGNKGYAATLLFSFDSESLTYKVEILELGTMFSKSDIESVFGCKISESKVNVAIIDPREIIKTELITK